MLPAPFKLERYFAQYEFNVRYLLCASDCESLTIQELLDLEAGAAERFGRLWLGYTETQGAPALRAEITRLFTSITPEEVLVHAGAEEAIFLFMQAALAPGDHVIVHRPCYQSHFEIARSMGCEVSAWNGRDTTLTGVHGTTLAPPDTPHEVRLTQGVHFVRRVATGVQGAQGWAPDLEELKSMLRPNTKAIVLSTPNNPTGYLMAEEMLRAIARIANEKGIWLFSDEVYRECEYDARQRLPSAADLGEKCVTLGAVSKTYGLPGLRIGWLAAHDRALLAKIAALKDYTTICSSAPSEFLAEVALRQREALIARSLATILSNLSLLDGFFSRRGDRFRWTRPGAGPVGFPQLIGEDVDVFCDQLVKQAGVLLLPGTVFDDPGNHFRLGFGRANLPEALAKLEEFLDEEQ